MKQTGSTLDHLTEAFVGDGIAVNSGQFNGLPTAEFKEKITAWLEEQGLGTTKINYKLRDWLFSRQRYWGEPFPILHEVDASGNPTGVVEALVGGRIAAALAGNGRLQAVRPTGTAAGQGKGLALGDAQRQALQARNEHHAAVGRLVLVLSALSRSEERQAFCDPEKGSYWMPVDLYVGGAEHAVLHLLYSRFWHKVLFDRGHVHTPEPFSGWSTRA